MSTQRAPVTLTALPSTRTLLLLRKFPFFPLVSAHPCPSQAFPCSPLEQEKGVLAPVFHSQCFPQTFCCWLAFPRGCARGVNPKCIPLTVFSGSFACTGAAGPDLQLVTGLFFCLKILYLLYKELYP